MRSRLLFLLTLLVPFFMLQSCVNDDTPAGDSLINIGDNLPQFSVVLNNGDTVTTKSLMGKISVIFLFNTSCPDCQKEFPELQRLKKAFPTDDVFVFGISRSEEAASIEAYWEQNRFTLPWSAQPDKKIYNLFATSGIPRIYISNNNGMVTAAFSDTDMPTLQDLIEAVMASGLTGTPVITD